MGQEALQLQGGHARGGGSSNGARADGGARADAEARAWAAGIHRAIAGGELRGSEVVDDGGAKALGREWVMATGRMEWLPP